MASSELERVVSDLSLMRDAMRLGKPYTRDHVNQDLVTALCGLLALLLILFTPLSSKLAFALGLLPGVLYYLRFTAHQHNQRAIHPSPWKEEKLTLRALAVTVPLVIVWLVWSRLGGPIDIQSASAAALYFMGVGLGVLGVIDPNRRRYLAGSAVLLVYGLSLPMLTPQQISLGGAIALLAGGLLSAGITACQLKADSGLSSPGELMP
jgi:hypothetical protein